MGKLTDKVALITGSDSGIGHASAVEFAREGANVIVNYLHDEEGANRTREEVEAQGPGRSSYKPTTATRTRSRSCSPPDSPSSGASTSS